MRIVLFTALCLLHSLPASASPLSRWETMTAVARARESVFGSAFSGEARGPLTALHGDFYERRDATLFRNGQPLGLDLSGLSATQLTTTMLRNPKLAGAIVLPHQHLCAPELAKVVRQLGLTTLAIVLDDPPPSALDRLHCLGRLPVTALFLKVGGAYITPESVGRIAPLRGLDISNLGPEGLRGLATLRNFHYLAAGVDVKAAPKLEQLRSLRHLELSTAFTDAAVSSVAKLTALRVLDLTSSTFYKGVERKLTAWRTLKQLRVLKLSRYNTVVSLAMLKPLTALRELALPYAPIGDALFPVIARNHKLTRLDLTGTRVTDAGLAAFNRLNQLRILRLPYTKLTLAQTALLDRMGQLRYLDLRGTPISPATIKQLTKLSQLRQLVLSNSHQLVRWARLHKLESAELRDASDATLCRLAALRNLARLRVRSGTIGPRGFRCLSRLPALRAVVFGEAVSLGRGLGQLTQLRHLDMMPPKSLSAMAELGKLRALRSLYLGEGVRDQHLPIVGKLTQLVTLSLSGSEALRGTGLRHLRRLRALRSLNLSESSLRSGLRHLLSLRKLELLKLDYCKVSAASTRKLASLPALRFLGASSLKLCDQEPLLKAMKRQRPGLEIDCGN